MLKTTRWTNTSRFLMPAFGLTTAELTAINFVNAYMQDKDRAHDTTGFIPVYAVFKPGTNLKFGSVLAKWEKDGIVLDEYDYSGGYVVIVLQFPENFRKDYELFLEGKYSKFSDEFKKLFPDKAIREKEGVYVEDLSLHFHIFHKTPGLRKYWEEQLGIEIDKDDPDFEYWGKPEMEDRSIMSEGTEEIIYGETLDINTVDVRTHKEGTMN